MLYLHSAIYLGKLISKGVLLDYILLSRLDMYPMLLRFTFLSFPGSLSFFLKKKSLHVNVGTRTCYFTLCTH